ncbi:hypothetical protein H696_04748 [Fonticula alba]|uniref:Protein BFR2 n=1 Tax=Fonticula alba TaxID=691883 RepID=A0A058Z2I1_FONAL|nr:hypothetical protein H696_04748 [Fonticula alba]KCV68454.1 hypothetical protein H696_04748 [Fonticula alba]|eukprot:XP_009496886.1 hypothetical protein H696_04748 [Fonticula alba]
MSKQLPKKSGGLLGEALSSLLSGPAPTDDRQDDVSGLDADNIVDSTGFHDYDSYAAELSAPTAMTRRSQSAQADALLSQSARYSGKTSSRKALYAESDDEEDSSEEEEEEEEEEAKAPRGRGAFSASSLMGLEASDGSDDEEDDGSDDDFEAAFRRYDSSKSSGGLPFGGAAFGSSEDEDASSDDGSDADEQSALAEGVSGSRKSIQKALGASTSLDRAMRQLEEEDAASSISIFAEQAVADAQKGKHVMNQTTLWNRSLDLRIRLQRCVTLSGRLPPPDMWGHFFPSEGEGAATEGLTSAAAAVRTELAGLLGDIANIQVDLLAQTAGIGPEAVADLRGKRPADDSPDALRALASEVAAIAAPHMEETLEHWSSRAQIATAGMGSGPLKAIHKSVPEQVSAVLAADRDRLVKRLRLDRRPAASLATMYTFGTDTLPTGDTMPSSVDEHDDQLIDDGDFYASLLQDFLASRVGPTGAATDVGADDARLSSALSARAEEQKRRAKQRRQGVDQKASKGRRIRHDIHPKLVNFCVPTPRQAPTYRMATLASDRELDLTKAGGLRKGNAPSEGDLTSAGTLLSDTASVATMWTEARERELFASLHGRTAAPAAPSLSS